MWGPDVARTSFLGRDMVVTHAPRPHVLCPMPLIVVGYPPVAPGWRFLSG